jgi:hypothetical protein
MLSKIAHAVVILCALGTAKADLITNPGFETGDFTGWTAGGSGNLLVRCNNPGAPAHSGNCDASFETGNPT